MDEFALAWFDWMFAAAWQAALVSGLVFLFIATGRRRISSQLRHLLLLIVLIKFATPPFLHSPTGFFSQPVVSQVARPNLGHAQFHPRHLFPSEDVFSSSASHLRNYKGVDLTATADQNVSVSEGSTSVSAGVAIFQSDWASTGRSWKFWLFLIYAVGVLVASSRLLLQYVRLRRIVTASTSQSDIESAIELSVLANHIGIYNVPELKLSNKTQSPFVTGIRRPVIVVPKNLPNQLSTNQLRIVVAHELVHICNRDLVTGLAEAVIHTFWWFHPAMWWLRCSLRHTREDCCDDRLVASQLVEPQDYCETIIEAAKAQTESPDHSSVNADTLAFGFANQEHPAGRRIRRMMDHSIARHEKVRLSAFCFAAAFAFAVLPGLRIAETAQSRSPASHAAQAPAQNTPQQESEHQPLERITGLVIDDQDRPIAGATIAARVTGHANHSQKYNVLLEEQTITSEDGTFEFKVARKANSDHFVTFAAEISSANCFQKVFFESNLEKQGQLIELEPYQLQRGMRINGRVAPPDIGGDQPVDPIVSIVASYIDKETRETLYRYMQCDQDGDFSCVVPSACELSIDVMAQNYATNSVKHNLKPSERSDNGEIEERDLGRIKLKHGTCVFGTARLSNGRPAAGVVLGMIEGDLTNPSDVSAVRTDREGRFRFLAHSGNCAILSLSQCRTRKVVNGFQQGLQADGEFPLIGPVFLDLNGKGKELEIDFAETESVTLSGVIKDVEGNPSPGVTVQCGWITRKGLVEVEWVATDDEGKYSTQVPKGSVPSLIIRDQWVFGEAYEPHLAKPRSDSSQKLFINPDTRLNEELEFKAASEDIFDLDWVMINRDRSPGVFERIGDIMKWYYMID